MKEWSILDFGAKCSDALQTRLIQEAIDSCYLAGSERLRMHDREICTSLHRGDTMTVVSEKSTGKIVVAYSTEIFVYKG